MNRIIPNTLVLSFIILTVYAGYFENEGCLRKFSNKLECRTCDHDYTLDNGICKKNDFNHVTKSNKNYIKVYIGS